MKNNTKKIVIGAVVLVALVALFAVLYSQFGPKAVKGSKHVTIEVVDNNSESTSYALDTDAEYLRQAMDELGDKGFTYDGTDSEYGIMISSVNGLMADYATDGAYWAIYVNGEYGQYGADSQPVADGDTYTFKYEVYAQ